MPNIGPIELIIVLLITLVILGPKRLPAGGRSLGRGIREFKGRPHRQQRTTRTRPIQRLAAPILRTERRRLEPAWRCPNGQHQHYHPRARSRSTTPRHPTDRSFPQPASTGDERPLRRSDAPALAQLRSPPKPNPKRPPRTRSRRRERRRLAPAIRAKQHSGANGGRRRSTTAVSRARASAEDPLVYPNGQGTAGVWSGLLDRHRRAWRVRKSLSVRDCQRVPH